MSQRGYPPPRDRSPQRQFDRRSSNAYTPLTTSSSYRPSNDSSQPPLDRVPPRGPRADSFRGGFSSTPRGRGASFTPRGGDSWDRDRDRDRDVRPQPSTFRRDDDRADWARRDERAPTFSRDRPYVGRDRSASPTRPRRDSKENLSTTFNRTQESGTSYFAGSARGSSDRGRGRGGWDRSRGRSSFIGERDRDLFPNRSRSREGWREREFDRPRNFGPESDRADRFERREYDRPGDRDTRARDHDIWPRDQSPGRSSTGNRAASPGALSSVSQDRKLEYDILRKPLTSSALQGRDARREAESDYFGPRIDGPRREPSFPQSSSAQNVPQSSSLGLDYGPPPSAPATAPATSISVLEKVPTTKVAKPELSPPVNSAFQPPSGPKADRATSVATSGQPTQPPITSSESRTKTDSSARQRQQFLENPHSLTDVSKSPVESLSERQPQVSSQSDRPLPPNVPSGPRLSSGTLYKPKTSPVAQQNVLPSAQPKSLATEQRSIPNVPTGPRSATILPPSGPRGSVPTGPAIGQGGPASSTWRRPTIEYRTSKPSIMGNMNRPHMGDRPLPQTMHPSTKQSPQLIMAQLADLERVGKATKFDAVLTTPSQTDAKKEIVVATTEVEMSAPPSDDDDADEEPESELDESYFADSEKTHAKEMERLRAKKPPLLLEDPVAVRLLIRIQLLGMIAEGVVPDSIQAVKEEKDVVMSDQPVEGLPSPQETSEESHSPSIEHPKPRGRPLKEPLINPIPTPPIEDLPFLQKLSTGTVVFEEPVEDEVEDEKLNTFFRTLFEKEAWEEKFDLSELCDFYRQKFPEWKHEIDKHERMKREYEATPDPGSPGAQSSVSVPPSLERVVARSRNATEFDMERAILMSQHSLKEDEERRERESASNAKPNYETEAVVPDMLKPAERDICWRFQDTNSFIPTDLAVALMQYVPPEDDFTDEEQSKFIMAFCQTPKKWGLIADQIVGRSYQDCIAHYYLTKNEIRYKELWRLSQPKRKRGRNTNKLRSTALISDMALNEDPDSTPVPVTDSGRPRRAAAPTFGDPADAEAAGIPPAKRLAMTPQDTTDHPTPKATKGRKAGTAPKPRRRKNQIQADQAALVVAQNNPDGSPLKGSGRIRPIHPSTNTQIPVMATSARQRSPQPPAVTSYWSVPEQQKFRQLVTYYGRDYAKIADFMKTKSQAMIKNHYTREISKGDVDLEKHAQIAEEKLARGESTGRLPSPIAPPKRKYDSGPPLTVQARPSSTNTETIPEVERSNINVKAPLVEDFPPNTLHRDGNGSIVAKPSPRNEMLPHSPLHLPVQTKEEFGRERPILAQKVMSGPPRGHFIEESFHAHNPQRQQHVGNDPIPQHHPPQLVELRGGEIPPVQARDLLGQSRDQIGHNQPSIQFRGLESERPLSSSKQAHSRNSSLVGVNTTAAEQQAAETLAMQNERRRMFPNAATQSPRSQALQASVAPRTEPFHAFAPQLHHHQQQHQSPQSQSQPQQAPPVAIKQEPTKPAPAKRSNVFSILNDDEPPARSVKRTSTDSSHRPIQTPPPQSTSAQPAYQQRTQDELTSRSSTYGVMSQHQGLSNINELRSVYSNSPAPAPSHRMEWLDKYDPRHSAPDRASNQSPLYPGVPPAPSSTTKTLMQSRGEGLRNLDTHPPRMNSLSRGQISSPPQQPTTPVSQYRSASTAPQQQHSRMSSLGTYGQNQQLGHDPRALTQAQQLPQSSQPQHLQPVANNVPPPSGTPISSMHHHRGQQSVDYAHRRLTIQEYKAQGNIEPSRDSRDTTEHRLSRDEPRSTHESQHRQIAPPPPQAHEQSRVGLEQRDVYRSETLGHQIPPPPSSGPQLNHLTAAYGGPPRAYNNTPPLTNYGREPRQMTSMHNQHAHHHHQSLSTQPPPPQHQPPPQQAPGAPSAYHHHHHQQGPLALPPQSHQGLAAHTHQSGPPVQQSTPTQPYREQSRFGQSLQQGLAPPQGHYRNYSQGGEERR